MPDRIELIRHTDMLFAENCYLLIGPSGRRAAVVDPGLESEVLLDTLEDRGITLDWIINTHGHLDHVAGNRIFKERTGARLIIHPGDLDLLMNVQLQLEQVRALGLPMELEVPPSPSPDEFFVEGEPFELDGVAFEVIHTPGHSPGGTCLRFGERLLVGDLLFQGSVGRTDLPGGSTAQLIHSIRQKLFRLPGETVCLPGHGESTTLAAEREHNPFVSDRAVDAAAESHR